MREREGGLEGGVREREGGLEEGVKEREGGLERRIGLLEGEGGRMGGCQLMHESLLAFQNGTGLTSLCTSSSWPQTEHVIIT